MTTATKSAKKSTAKKSTAKKSSAKKSAAKSSGGDPCWPGYQAVPGKEPGTKGSCEPKAHQTAGEKKADAKAAAATKQRKGR